jgi:hypothetical protein
MKKKSSFYSRAKVLHYGNPTIETVTRVATADP